MAKRTGQTVTTDGNETKPKLKIPRHVAIIMDGNGRWARKRHLPHIAGHRAGVEAVRRLLNAAGEMGVEYVTIYAFSTENWGRPKEEVSGLIKLFWEALNKELGELHKNGARLRHLGRVEDLPANMVKEIVSAQELTKDNTRINLSVCFNYGGRAEIVDACKRIIQAGIPAEQVTEELLSNYMYSAGLPDPDLVIRTASEMRLSNFLIWQTAYSEYYATETLWPDFTKADFEAAIQAYTDRERRFGVMH